MFRKRWVVAALSVALVTIAVTGGVVLAQEEGTSGDSPAKSLVARVASILGLSEDEVQGAFDQAAGEVRDEMLQRKMDRLVESGRLTPEQAQEYLEWYESRPESMPGFGPGLRGHGFGGGKWRGGHGRHGGGMFGHEGSCPFAPAPEGSETPATGTSL